MRRRGGSFASVIGAASPMCRCSERAPAACPTTECGGRGVAPLGHLLGGWCVLASRGEETDRTSGASSWVRPHRDRQADRLRTHRDLQSSANSEAEARNSGGVTDGRGDHLRRRSLCPTNRAGNHVRFSEVQTGLIDAEDLVNRICTRRPECSQRHLTMDGELVLGSTQRWLRGATDEDRRSGPARSSIGRFGDPGVESNHPQAFAE